MATAPDPSSNPLAWARWARQQDPGTYDLGGGLLSQNPDFVKTSGGMLRSAGLWNPEWDGWANFQPDYTDSGNGGYFGPDPDFSSLGGYELQNTRGPGNSAFLQLMGPDGQQAGLEQYEQSGSWKSDDYMKMAAVAAAMTGAGAFLNGGFGGLGAAASDPIGAYMTTGAAEGSTIGNALTGAGGQAGAVGSGSIAAQMGIPMDFDPSSLFQNVADPTNALQPLGDVGASAFQPFPATGLEPMNFDPSSLFQGMADPTAALQPLPDMAALPGAMPGAMPSMGGDPYAQTVEVTGQKIPFEPMAPTGLQPLPAFDGSSLGIADSTAALAPLGPTFSMPGAMPPVMPPGGGVRGGLLDSLPSGVKSAIEVGLPLAGAVAGSQPGGGGTVTRESRTDPRIDPAIYQQFLPEWSKQFAASNGGVNDTMRAGWNQQLGLLNDPGIAQQLNGVRNNGLLNGPVAGNPFTTGQMRLPSGGQGLLGQMQMPRDPSRRFTG